MHDKFKKSVVVILEKKPVEITLIEKLALDVWI